ncbi:MAG: 50S ribosomal protein L4 [Thiotrichales bacterium]|nr:MAG: 50S ribosomal protein L4 [Thiotrichales bacterium]
MVSLQLEVLDSKNKITLSEDVFGTRFNRALVHQVVTSLESSIRRGSKWQKNRAEVKATNKKPWKQKGTGRARAGTSASPIWRGGGMTFNNRGLTNFIKKINKKMLKVAWRSVWSQLLRENRINVISRFELESHKTKELVKKMQDLNLGRTLVVLEEMTDNVFLAARNLSDVSVCELSWLWLTDMIRYKSILITEKALGNVEEWLKS